MDSLEVLKSLLSIPDHCVGVFPADQIPRVWTCPTAYVFNTDDHRKPGTHWVSIYVDTKRNGYYFDSYGIEPMVPDHINRLRKNCKQFRCNTVQLQSLTSNVCGQFCIMFLHYMCAGMGVKKFMENFSTNLFRNDEIARNFVSRKSTKKNFIGNGGSCNVRFLQNSCCKMSLL